MNKNKKVTVACEFCFSRNYAFNKSNSLENKKLVVKKYCPKCNKSTIHSEAR